MQLNKFCFSKSSEYSRYVVNTRVEVNVLQGDTLNLSFPLRIVKRVVNIVRTNANRPITGVHPAAQQHRN
jgi:hypothetical protein